MGRFKDKWDEATAEPITPEEMMRGMRLGFILAVIVVHPVAGRFRGYHEAFAVIPTWMSPDWFVIKILVLVFLYYSAKVAIIKGDEHMVHKMYGTAFDFEDEEEEE